MAKQHKTQLYTLIRNLSLSISDKDELGSIIAFSIITSLLDFSSNSGAEQDIMFEQSTAIYQGLAAAFIECQDTDSFQTVCRLHVQVNDFLFSATNNDFLESQKSPLLQAIVATLLRRRGSIEDVLRRNGIELADAIMDKGPLVRKFDFLTQDYQLIQTHFTMKSPATGSGVLNKSH